MRDKACALPDLQDRAGVTRFDILEEPAVPTPMYKVIVRGRLSPGLVTALEGFDAADCERGLTHLVGPVPDQDVLHRVFRVLRDLNIELISVNPLSERPVGST